MVACSYLKYCWSRVYKGSDGKSSGGRRYSYVPLYLRMDPLSSYRRYTWKELCPRSYIILNGPRT